MMFPSFREPLSCLYLLLFPLAASSLAQVEIRARQFETGSDHPPVLVIRSEATGSVPFSFTGLGAIRAGSLVAGASKTYTYKKGGVLQYRIGRGDSAAKGILPLETGTRTVVRLSGLSFEPSTEAPPVRSAGPDFSFQPAADGALSIRHSYGPAFDHLTVEQKIKLVEESPKSDPLAPEDKRKLLGLLYNQKGVEAANLKNYAKAETALLQATKLVPGRATISTNLAFAIAAQANLSRSSGDSRRAETRFREALGILERAGDSNLASQVRTALASLYVEEGQALAGTNDPRAVSLYKRALEEDPAQPAALFELGKRAYAEYDLDTALGYFEAAYRRAPQKELAELIEKVRVEIDQAGDFVTEDRGDFKISFEGREVKSIAKAVRKLLSEAQRDIGRKLGLRPDTTIPVVIYRGGQFQRILGLHSWAGGAYDGKIRLPIADLTDQDLRSGGDRIGKLVFHEYAHALLHDRAPSARIPIWFHEGVAQLAAGQNPSNPNLHRQMVNAVEGGFIPPPSEMSGDFASVPDEGEARILYLVSYSFIRFLLEEHGGWSRLRKVIDKMVSGADVHKAMESSYRRSLVELENEWIEDLDRYGPRGY